MILSHVTLPFVVSHGGVLKGMSDYPIRIEVRPLLICGNTGSGPGSVFIMLADDLSRKEATETLWHEFVHIFRQIGGKTDPAETEVEAIARRLAVACPEILELCGVADKFGRDERT